MGPNTKFRYICSNDAHKWYQFAHSAVHSSAILGTSDLSVRSLQFIHKNSLVNIQKAIENGPVEIVDLPSYKMVDLSIVM